MEHTGHGRLVNAHDHGCVQCGGGRHAQQLPGETPFPKKVFGIQNRDDGFVALLRNHSKLDPAGLDIEHGIGRIPLREGQMLLRGSQRRFAVANSGKKGMGIERCGSFSGLALLYFPVGNESDGSTWFCSQFRSQSVHTCAKSSMRSFATSKC